MFGRSFRIATIGGIPVNVDSSWIWIAVLAIYTLFTRFEQGFGLDGTRALVYAVLGAALFFGSVFLHELAHAVTARLSGIAVEGITLVFFGGFTAARSEQKGAGPAFAIAALGPATSLAIGGALLVAASIVEPGSASPLQPSSPGAEILRLVARINIAMAVFNVLPGLPLDGGRMVQAAVWGVTRDRDKGTRIAAYGGMAVGVALFGLAVLELTRDDVFEAVWIGLIGMFIFQGARAAQQRIALERRLSLATVADAMDPPPPTVPADLTLSETLDRFLRGHEEEAFPVVDGDTVIGMISFSSARELGARDPLRPARDAAIPLDQVVTATPREPLSEVFERIGPHRSALVLDDGRLVGSLDARSVVLYATRAS